MVYRILLAGVLVTSCGGTKKQETNVSEKQAAEEKTGGPEWFQLLDNGQDVEMRGEVQVFVGEDMASGKSSIHHKFKKDGSGGLVDLEFAPGQAPAEGGIGEIEGHVRGNSIKVRDIQMDPPSMELLTGPMVRSLAVILVDLQDLNSLYTPAEAENAAFTLNNEFYSQASFNRIQFEDDADNNGVADVFGPFVISASSADSCADNYHEWGDEAEVLAAAAGVNFALYQHVMFILPNMSNCGFTAMGQVGSLTYTGYKKSWIRTELETPAQLPAHELGHNIGTAHSSDDPDNNNVKNNEYGDFSCNMGNYIRNLNSSKLFQLNAFVDYPSYIAQGLTGTYDLQPLFEDIATPGVRILKIAKPLNNKTYFLSYRDEGNLDSNYVTGVSITAYAGSGHSNSLYIDTLADGQSFVDSAHGITVQQVGLQPDGSLRISVTDNVGAPTGLTGVLKQKKHVFLDWNAPANEPGAIYRIYRSINNGAYSEIATATLTEYTNSNAPVGTLRYYVKTQDGSGNLSAASNIVTVIKN